MRPIFVGGCPRSGTTLLGALLGAHSRVVCVPEAPFKFRLLRALDRDDGTVLPADVSEVLEASYKFRLWGVAPEAVADPGNGVAEDASGASERIRYREALQRLVRRYARERGEDAVDVWVDHTPYNVRYARRMLDAFPEGRLVHLVRDGRGVAASILPLDFGPSTILDAAKQWSAWLGYGLAAEQWDPERVRRLSFEDLVRSPEETLSGLRDWLGLEPEGPGGATEYDVPRFTRDHHALVTREPDPQRAAGWRRSLSSRQIESYEAVTQDLLSYLGYELMHGDEARLPSTPERALSAVRGRLAGLRNAIRHRVRRWRFVGRSAETDGA